LSCENSSLLILDIELLPTRLFLIFTYDPIAC
jgi:hypothetical protein